jgi:hypothetical protein
VSAARIDRPAGQDKSGWNRNRWEDGALSGDDTGSRPQPMIRGIVIEQEEARSRC